ncbi:hypothetical protein EOM09_05550 [bacterium]|nr:hypothetical protein [bacterium]
MLENIFLKFIRIANAASPFDPLNVSGNLNLNEGDIVSSLSPIAINIIKILIGSLGVVFLFIIIYSGFVLIFSKGNSEKIKSVMSIISKAIIGIIIIFFSYAIIMFVMNIIQAIIA